MTVPCFLCFRDLASVTIMARAQLDYRGLPSTYVKTIQTQVKYGFYTCEECSRLIQAKDRDGLEQRVAVWRPVPGDTRDIEKEKMTKWCSSRLNQQVLLIATQPKGKSLKIYDYVEPSLRVVFDLLVASVPNSSFPKFKNGVELLCAPQMHDVVFLEEIKSTGRGRGCASSVMRVAIASADVHGVVLVGIVEAIPTDPPGMSDAELYAWYERLGFAQTPPLPNSIRREPDVSKILEERRRLLAAALQAIK